MIKVVAALWLLLFVLPAAAFDEAALLRTVALYKQGVDGDEVANEEAQRRLLKMVEAEPDEPVLQAYLGSTYALQGRDAWLPWRKLGYTERGLDQMAGALEMLGTGHARQRFDGRAYDMLVKLIVAINFTQVPAFFGRYEQGMELFDELLKDPRYGALRAEQRSEIAFYVALAAINGEQRAMAREMLHHAVQQNPGGEFALRAGALQRELESE